MGLLEARMRHIPLKILIFYNGKAETTGGQPIPAGTLETVLGGYSRYISYIHHPENPAEVEAVLTRAVKSDEMKIVIADSKYDTIKNYEYVRGKGAIAIIDYNPRRENLKKCDLISRGYDQNGQPFSPCGLLCRPNGFDEKRQRLTFCCFKQCQNLKYQALKDLQGRFDIATCPHLQNQTGFVRHMYIKNLPRLINEIPRGSKCYMVIKKHIL